MSKKIFPHLDNEGETFLVPFFNLLNAEGIRYSVLRNYNSLPSNTGGSDVDIWVHENDLQKCELILKKVSSETDMPLVSFYDAPTQYKVCYMGVSDGIQIDVFKGGVYNGNVLWLSAEDIMNNTIIHNGISVLDERYADITSYIKEIYYNAECRQKYIDKLYDTADLFDKEYLLSHLSSLTPDFVSLLYKSLQERTLKENAKVLSDLCKSSKKSNYSVSKVSFFLSKFKRLFKQPGFVICVEGTDGSGKSFIIDSIAPMLNGAFHNHVIYNHLRPNAIPDLGVLLGKKVKDENMTVCSDPHANKPSGFVMSIFRWGYYLIDYTFGYFKNIYPGKATRTHIYLFDRYYYDYYMDQRRAHINLPTWIIRMGEFLVPTPDIILCLGGNPDKIYTRKPETSLEEVIRQTNALKTFCESRSNTTWVDTTLTPEESVNQAMNAIIAVMEKRFRGIKYI